MSPSSADPSPSPQARTLGARQTSVLEALWEMGEVTVREVTEHLRAGGADLAYTTVLTLMSRLAARGLLTRRRVGRADLYRAAVDRSGVEAALSREAIDRLLSAHGEVALAAFAARMREGHPEQLARLRALLEEPEE
ncbi:BlaI/MecI/CopY family transcriptional regulator [Miltoncostaea marina]|uniref:BlaI/MecI/CopY family transcriptional regulator n=1 Tax=Miltoncostaea marina TaxID=2843215 RepID=UPI001C3E4A1F|nr:BlaI/MecI/CopY family transcriptional regulator [Miltoncostaea marina]